ARNRGDPLPPHVGQRLLRIFRLSPAVAAARPGKAVHGVDLPIAIRVVGRLEILAVHRWVVQDMPVGVDDRDSGLHRFPPGIALMCGRPRRVAAFYYRSGVDHQPRGAPPGDSCAPSGSLGARIAGERPGWRSTRSRCEEVPAMATRTNGTRRDDTARYSDFAHTG